MRDYTKFFTPNRIADKIVDLADIEIEHTILEPHAGMGSLIRAIYRKYNYIPGETIMPTIHTCELYKTYTLDITTLSDLTFIGDFLRLPLKEYYYDRIIANPPFGNETNLEAHISKMYALLKPGGKMVAIVPKDYVPPVLYCPIELENWSTNKDGTKTAIQIIIIDK